MRDEILVLGGDGYLGWPTALHLSARGHQVTVVDNMVRREYDREMGVDSLVPIASLQERVTKWEQISGHAVNVRVGNLTDAAFTYRWSPRRSRTPSSTSASSARLRTR